MLFVGVWSLRRRKKAPTNDTDTEIVPISHALSKSPSDEKKWEIKYTELEIGTEIGKGK